MGEEERIEAWCWTHGEYPLRVLGYVDDRGSARCHDHPSTKRVRTPLLAGTNEAEEAKCVECGRYLRKAEKAFTVTEADLEASRA